MTQQPDEDIVDYTERLGREALERQNRWKRELGLLRPSKHVKRMFTWLIQANKPCDCCGDEDLFHLRQEPTLGPQGVICANCALSQQRGRLCHR